MILIREFERFLFLPPVSKKGPAVVHCGEGVEVVFPGSAKRKLSSLPRRRKSLDEFGGQRGLSSIADYAEAGSFCLEF